MGFFSRKSTTNQSTTNLQTTNNFVNDGDYAGVSGNVSHDESVVDFKDDHSVSNEIDNSVELNGDYAGAGVVNILDGGAIEQSFDFATSTIEENSIIARESISAVSDNANSVVNALVDSQDNAFRSYDKVVGDSLTAVNNATQNTLEAIEGVSGEYAESLTSFANSYVEGISDVQMDSSQNNKEQLKVIAELAQSTSLQGQDIVAENSTKMIMYVMGGIAFVALMGGAVVIFKGGK